jgi:hypothetical protein
MENSVAEVTPEVDRLWSIFTRHMSRVEIMQALTLKDEKHFRTTYLQVGQGGTDSSDPFLAYGKVFQSSGSQ